MKAILVFAIFTALSAPAVGQERTNPDDIDQQRLADAYNHKDAQAMAMAFSEQGVRVTPSGIFRGRDEIRRSFQSAIDIGLHDFVAKRFSSQAVGDLTFNIGEWRAMVGAQPFHGFYTSILRREGDEIKVFEETVTLASPER